MSQESLWEVHFMSSYYDNDPRMPGTVPVDKSFYVVASGHDEALEKAEPELKKLRKKYKKDGTTVVANYVALENLVPARNSKNDGRMGYHSTQDFKSIELSLKSDKQKFRLAVCLVPINR